MVVELDTKFLFRFRLHFFCPFSHTKLNLKNQINIAIRKVNSNQLIAGMLSSNFNEKVKEFIVRD